MLTQTETSGWIEAVAADPAREIENKVAPRVAEAQLLRVVDQQTLGAVSDRLVANKLLQKEAGDVFDPVISKAHEAHKAAIAAKKHVTDPLTQEESILKLLTRTYVIEQAAIAEAAERKAREAREAMERAALADAEARRQLHEAEVNARLQREHEEEVERALAMAGPEAPPELVQQICATPAPAAVSIPLDIPELPPVASAATAAFVMPNGMSAPKRYKAEVYNLALLAQAVGCGKAPVSYLDPPNMKALNARARADGAAMNVPGVRAVQETLIAQRLK